VQNETVASMPTMALIASSVVLGSIFPLVESSLPMSADAIVKGLCVGLLALAAVVSARNLSGWMLAAVLAAGTTGDVLLALPGGFKAGAAAFGAGHIVAIWLYLCNRAPVRSFARMTAIATLLIVGVVLPRLLLPGDFALEAYALLLTGMVAAALASRFDRRVAIGALMFLISDALIGVRMQFPEANVVALGWLVWWLYYFGQLLIFWFVSKAIRSDQLR